MIFVYFYELIQAVNVVLCLLQLLIIKKVVRDHFVSRSQSVISL